jgi:putative phosphoribosyl transferase
MRSAGTGRRFRDRAEAGRVLAKELERYRDEPNLVVLALPRGGVPVAYEVARALDAPLDVFVVRKLGAPGHEELAIGAIAGGGTRVVNERVVAELGLKGEAIERAAAAEEQELVRRQHAYRGERGPVEVAGRTVILIDDGLATGATMRAAALALREQDPGRLVVAVPVAAEQTCDELREDVDEVVCASTPQPFLAVGAWYDDFSQTTDEEVRELLELAYRERPPPEGL